MECKSVGCPLCEKVYGCLCGSKVDECVTCSHNGKCPMQDAPAELQEVCRPCYADKARKANHHLFKWW